MSRTTLHVLIAATLAGGSVQSLGQTPTGPEFTYQGQLTESGSPVDGLAALRFRLFDASSGGNLIAGPADLMSVPVVDGLFTVEVDFGADAFGPDERWLEIEVRTTNPGVDCAGQPCTLLSPRQKVTVAPIALALRHLRTETTVDAPNVIGGDETNTVSAGISGATVAGGKGNLIDAIYGTIGGGGPDTNFGTPGNAVYDRFGTVAGGTGNLAGRHASVGGGSRNEGWGSWSAIGGGDDNRASQYATVSGGVDNQADGFFSAIGGGASNKGYYDYSTVGGGSVNEVFAEYATIGGGGPSVPGDPANTNNRVYDQYGTIGGGGGNRAGSDDADTTTAPYAAVAGGQDNQVLAAFGFIGGGGGNFSSNGNRVFDSYGAIAGGSGNIVGIDDALPYEQWFATIGGGVGNQALAAYATIGGGGWTNPGIETTSNVVFDGFGTIGGGGDNRAGTDDGDSDSSEGATVGGGKGNRARGPLSTVAGGGYGVAGGVGSVVSGGFANFVYDDYCTIGGGDSNRAGSDDADTTIAPYATVAGGQYNQVLAAYGFIGGGGADEFNGTTGNRVFDPYCTIGGGSGNEAGSDDADPFNGWYSTVGGGYRNLADGVTATVGGGQSNVAHGEASTVCGGETNEAAHAYSMVPGGAYNLAGGVSSFAAGYLAKVRSGQPTSLYYSGDWNGDEGTFVWADVTPVDFVSTGPNQFLIRATGGVGIGTPAPAAPLHVSAGQGVVRVDSISNLSPAVEFRNLSAGTPATLGTVNFVDDVGAFPGQISYVDDTVDRMTFRVGVGTEIVRITSDGRVGINTTSPSQELHVVGDIVYTGTITDISDERLKENIAPVEDAISKIQRLRGVYFSMTDTPEQRDIGLIAQDVQAVLPEAVQIVDPTCGYLGVSYPSLIPVLVEAIKAQEKVLHEQARCIDEQVKSNETKDERIKELSDRIDRLECILSHAIGAGQ